MNRLVLASASPRRRELLEGLGIKFDVIVSSEDESIIDKNLSPDLYACELAFLKATSVAKMISDEKKRILISADTVVSIDGEILGKPKNKTDAKEMLKKLSGKEHYVYTGLCVMRMKDGFATTKACKTKVKFKELTDDLIDNYINTNEPMDKAGAYGIQGKGAVMVESITGDYFNVVGLPLSMLFDVLKEEFGIDIFNKELMYEFE